MIANKDGVAAPENHQQEIARLQREIAARQARLAQLVLGDQSTGVFLGHSREQTLRLGKEPAVIDALAQRK